MFFDSEKKEDDDKKKNTGPIGGFPFFLSTISLLILGILNLIALPSIQNEDSPANWFKFAIGIVVGILIAKVFIANQLSVACHELKHYLIAAFAGNKFKEMDVQGRSGHYTYTYTKKTAKFNALIALAPYWFPMATITAIFLAIPVYLYDPELTIPIVGAGVGADLLMNMRDISPVQTDLTKITGGIKVALAFVIGMNLSILTIIGAWVSQGFNGLKLLGIRLWEIVYTIFIYYQNTFGS